jgi:hypothetical protein
MSNAPEEPELTELLRDLTRELRRLEREVEPDRRIRPPTGNELARFTSEVAIPGLILLLKSQIKALELLRRTIRIAEGRQVRGASTGATEVRNRAEQLGSATLTQLDAVLADLQDAIEGRPANERSNELITEARELQERVQAELSTEDTEPSASEVEQVDIDVEAELRSLKDQVEEDPGDDGNGHAGGGDTDGSDDSNTTP